MGVYWGVLVPGLPGPGVSCVVTSQGSTGRAAGVEGTQSGISHVDAI